MRITTSHFLAGLTFDASMYDALRFKNLDPPRKLRLRVFFVHLFLVAWVAPPFTPAWLAVLQNTYPGKSDTSQEAAVFDRLDNLVRYEDDGTGVQKPPP